MSAATGRHPTRIRPLLLGPLLRIALLAACVALPGCPTPPIIRPPTARPLPLPPQEPNEPPRDYLSRLEAIAPEAGQRPAFDLAIGRLRAQLGDMTGARARLQMAFEVEPDHPETGPLYFEVVLALDEPSAWLAGRQPPTTADDPAQLARWIIAADDDALASDALAARPGNPVLLTALARIALEQGDTGRAWLLAGDVLSAEGVVPAPWRALARLILIRASMEHDPQVVGALLAEAPDDSTAMARVRGLFLLDNARYVEARDALDSAIRRYPLDQELAAMAIRAAGAAAQFESLGH